MTWPMSSRGKKATATTAPTPMPPTIWSKATRRPLPMPATSMRPPGMPIIHHPSNLRPKQRSRPWQFAAVPTTLSSSTLCIAINEAVSPKTVTAFVASGNFLNWAAASKLDVQKKILTGGKYDAATGRLVMESRGCLGRRFVKKICGQQCRRQHLLFDPGHPAAAVIPKKSMPPMIPPASKYSTSPPTGSTMMPAARRWTN